MGVLGVLVLLLLLGNNTDSKREKERANYLVTLPRNVFCPPN